MQLLNLQRASLSNGLHMTTNKGVMKSLAMKATYRRAKKDMLVCMSSNQSQNIFKSGMLSARAEAKDEDVLQFLEVSSQSFSLIF